MMFRTCKERKRPVGTGYVSMLLFVRFEEEAAVQVPCLNIVTVVGEEDVV